MKSILNVCYAANNKYTMQVGVSIYSLLVNNKDIDIINLFILNNDFTIENKKALQRLVCKFGRKAYIINSTNELKVLLETGLDVKVDNGGAVYNKTLGLEAYVRFFIVNLLPLWVEKVLYLDCDTIVCGSLKKIADRSMTHCIEAVVDCWPHKYNAKIGLKKESMYFNAGVQLINIKRWRDEGVLDLYLEHIKMLIKPYRLFDQDIMNIVMENKIGKLSLEYNMMFTTRRFKPLQIYDITGKTEETFYTKREIEYAKENMVIIHYAGDPMGKPWRTPNADKNTKLWKYYYQQSPWGGDGLRKSQDINEFVWILKSIKIIFERFFIYIKSEKKLSYEIIKYMNREIDNIEDK